MRLIAAALMLHLVLILPNHPNAVSWGALWVFPLELPAILLAMLALGQGRLTRWVRLVLTVVFTLLTVLKAADLVSFNALSRGFNPVADLPLIDAFVRLLSGTLGWALTGVALGGAILAIAVVAWLIWWATGVWARVKLGAPGGGIAGVVAVLAGGVAVADVGQTMGRGSLPVTLPGTAFTARIGVERVEMMQRTLIELRVFRDNIANDPFNGAEGLFMAIDRDVLVIFIESYGRTSHDTPFFAELHRETLDTYADRLGDLGLSVQSGFLGSPTHGGQSWLAHATVSNGMWIDNQVRYRAALASGRETLFHHAANAGLRTATVMPQITLDWPEAQVMGFEDIIVFDGLGYAGLPFNWVTMPDQYTLSAMDRLLRDDSDPRHLFAQIALISSHAPWVPVPDILPWEDIGDGSVFNEVAASGDPPAVVWRDYERVRRQYRLAVDYALQAVFEYAILHAEDPPLMIVMGDHQTGDRFGLDPRREVPLHVIGPAHLVSALSEIAPADGLLPEAESLALPMDVVRDVVLNAYAEAPILRARE